MFPNTACCPKTVIKSMMHLRSKGVLELRAHGVCEVPNKVVPECDFIYS